MQHDAKQIIATLDATCTQHDYAGSDPFDALNSKLFQWSQLNRSRFCRLAWLQVFKRNPINLRKLALVPKTHNAKALSLFTRSYLVQGKQADVDHCLKIMLNNRASSKDWGNGAWGYPFDWQAKAFFVPKSMPNVICTAYAVLALKAHGSHDELIIEAANFVEKHLTRNDDSGRYIAYVPCSSAMVHNASLWGAYILLQAYALNKQQSFLELANDAIDYTLNAQSADGSWAYGMMPHHQFIDGFHTSYILEALYRCNEVLKSERIEKAIASGLIYYSEQFFESDGLPKYYHNNPYPVDPHSAAQAILTFTLIDRKKHKALIDRIVDYTLNNLWDEKRGAFIYQKHKRFDNKITYIRWTQAWMHLALSTYLAD